jgi:hypothetical protein
MINGSFMGIRFTESRNLALEPFDGLRRQIVVLNRVLKQKKEPLRFGT